MSSCQDSVDSSEPPAKRLLLHVEEVGVGSLVWARLPNSIWWPAMVEKTSSSYYRVVYFDDACCLQGWMNHQEILLFTGSDDNIDGETCADGVDLRAQLANAVRLARCAMTRSRRERVLALRTRDQLMAARCAGAVPCLGMSPSGNERDLADRVVDVALAEGRRREDHVEEAALGLECSANGGDDGVLDVASDDDDDDDDDDDTDDDSSEVEVEAPSSEIAPGGDGRALPSDADTEPAGDAFAPSSASSGAATWPTAPSLDGDVGARWEPPSDDAVVPASDEAVCPEPGDTRFDAVVPWDAEEDADDDEDDDDEGQGWPSSEALVPDECDGASDGDSPDVEE